MTAAVAWPVAVAIVVATAATAVHRHLPPRVATRFVTLALVLVAGAAVPTALMLALAFLAHAPLLGFGFEWCARAIGLHGSVRGWLGVPLVGLVGLGSVRLVRLVRMHRRLRLDRAGPVHVAHSHTPYAVTLPGRGGRIVISTAMVDLLDDTERRIVLAHEEAHAANRHDRYLLVAEVAAAAMPLLRGLARRVNYSIERWADEAAAAACGDRRRVAVTLGKVALQANPATVAGFAGLGVAARMRALLSPPIGDPRRHLQIAMWVGLSVVAAASTYQLHHLEQLATALCPH